MNDENHGNAGTTSPRVDNPFASEPIVAAPTGTMSAALVQREVAEVQAAMVIAQKFPRDPKSAVDRILTACTRQGLAEVAVYQYARGGQNVSGASIRLAEELARQWGNMLSGVTELSRQSGVSECLAYAWDLETNYRDEKRFQVRHWRDTKKGGYAITEERDIYEVIANMGARRKRACVLAVIPGDVQEAAIRQCELTLRTKEEVTPERIAKMTSAFEAFGVTKEHLEKRIQRRMDAVTPALLVQLRNIYNSLKDGMSLPEDWFDIDSGDSPAPSPASKTESVKQRMEKAGKAKQADEHVDKTTGEITGKYTAESAIKLLEGKRTVKSLDEAYDDICDDFRLSSGGVPPEEVGVKYTEMRESLAEREKV